jgi:acetyl esterase
MSPFVKVVSLLLILLWNMPPAMAQEKEKKTKTPSTLPKPTQANFKYGPHERNVFDFWQAKSDQPTPLVIFIHGGGFVGGDKNNLNSRSLQQLLDAGISVAAINYRFVQHAPLDRKSVV